MDHIPDELLKKLQAAEIVDLSYNILREVHIPKTASMKVHWLYLNDNILAAFPKLNGTTLLVK